MSRLRALLATLRIANAPSVVSNVWLGYMAGPIFLVIDWKSFGSVNSSFLPMAELITDWHQAATLAGAGLCLYFSGNLANDWFDRGWDESKRPERALPSRLFKPGSYLVASIFASLVGIALAFSVRLHCGLCALAITGLIALYTWLHKRTLWSIIPMGLCRSGLYLLGFMAFFPRQGFGMGTGNLASFAFIGMLATGLFAYIAGLTLSARYEGMADPPPGPLAFSKALLALPVLAMSCWFFARFPVAGLIGILPYVIWLALCLTRYRKPIPKYVSGLLAGIPLVDFIAAAPLAIGMPKRLWGDYQTILMFPNLMALLLIPLAAFVLGRLLQKVAPAT